jgi:hypothetical protein
MNEKCEERGRKKKDFFKGQKLVRKSSFHGRGKSIFC